MIEIKNLRVDLGDFVLSDVSIEIMQGEYFVILGPTGAGKTVLLESVAGLYPIKGGEIWLKGKEVTKVEPEERRVSIVYQDHVLFPHLSMMDNIIIRPASALKLDGGSEGQSELGGGASGHRLPPGPQAIHPERC